MTRTIPSMEKAEAPPSPGFGIQTFRALRCRDYRLLWISLIVSSIGTWMQIVAQSPLVLQITRGSAIALGIVALAQASSFFLITLIGGPLTVIISALIVGSYSLYLLIGRPVIRALRQ